MTGFDPNAPFTGNKYLLSIAIDDYDGTGGFQKLTYPVRDAKMLVEVLKCKYDFKQEHIHELYNQAALKDEITLKIDEINQKATAEDQLLLFFAGHGAADKDIGYWITRDAKENLKLNLRISTVLEDLLQNCCCSQILIVVDCCYSGTLSEKALQEAMFAKLKGNPIECNVITSSSKYEVTNDNSSFFNTLHQILTHEEIDFFPSLTARLSMKLGDAITTMSSEPMVNTRFILRKSDQIKPLLREACYDLNFDVQKFENSGFVLSPFNLLYLHGTDLCCHHLFVRYFFNELAGKMEVFSLIPQITRISGNEGLSEQKIWKFFTGSEHPLSPDLLKTVGGSAAANGRVFFIKITKDFPVELYPTLEDSLVAFWQKLNQQTAAMQASDTRFFFLILDERGPLGKIDSARLEAITTSPAAALLNYSSISPLSLKSLKSWKSRKELNIGLEQFKKISFDTFVPEDLFVANSILKICSICERRQLANEILLVQ